MAMTIQRQTGGNLSEISRTPRRPHPHPPASSKQRAGLDGRGRLQGWTLVALPFIMSASDGIKRRYVSVLFDMCR